MTIETFVKKIYSLSPDKDTLQKELGSDFSELILKNRFQLKKLNEPNDNSFISFVHSYQLEKFMIRNFSFAGLLVEYGDFISIVGIEGGYLVQNKFSKEIFVMYAEDPDDLSLFCENDEQLYQILLIVAEFSSKSFVSDIANDDEVIESYIEKCETICPTGYFDFCF